MTMPLYKDAVTIYRPRTGARTSGGALHVGESTEYSGENVSADPAATQGLDKIIEGVPCSIQFRTPETKTASPSPAGTPVTAWYVFFPRTALARGSLKQHDELVDQDGNRYYVEAPYWNILGYRPRVRMLEPN